MSCFFLILTFGVYLALDSLNNLNGLIVRTNVVCIFLMTSCLMIMFNFEPVFHDIYDVFACKMVGFIGYFFIMAQFAWMAVLSFDIFWTFKKVRLPKRRTKTMRYLLYSLLAWGWAFFLTLALVLADIFVDDEGLVRSPAVS